jgi:hypothetical protein
LIPESFRKITMGFKAGKEAYLAFENMYIFQRERVYNYKFSK